MAGILFVCTGNTCRSPIAEAIFNDSAVRRGLRVRATSAGLQAGGHIAVEASDVLTSRGIDVAGRAAVQLSHELLEGYVLVLCMEAWQVAVLAEAFPDVAEKVFVFGDLVERMRRSDATGGPADLLSRARDEPAVADHDIPDPLGRGTAAYLATTVRIVDLVETLLAFLTREALVLDGSPIS